MSKIESDQKAQNRPIIVIASVIVIAVMAYIVFTAVRPDPAAEPVLESADFGTLNDEVASIPDGYGGVEVGDVAPDFRVNTLDETTVMLSDYAGKPVMINFWATWCAPCRLEMPEMQKAFEAYQDDGFVILALNQDESAETVKQFFYDEMGLTFTPLLDENSRVAAEYGVHGVFPSSLFINADGIVTARHFGVITEGQLSQYLADILPQADAH